MCRAVNKREHSETEFWSKLYFGIINFILFLFFIYLFINIRNSIFLTGRSFSNFGIGPHCDRLVDSVLVPDSCERSFCRTPGQMSHSRGVVRMNPLVLGTQVCSLWRVGTSMRVKFQEFVGNSFRSLFERMEPSTMSPCERTYG